MEILLASQYRKTLTLSETRDRLISMRKIGGCPGRLDLTMVVFPPHTTARDLLDEFEEISSIVISDDMPKKVLGGIHRTLSVREIFVKCAEGINIPFPKTLQRLHILPESLIPATTLTTLIGGGLGRRGVGEVDVYVHDSGLVWGWIEITIHRAVRQIFIDQRRNIPRDITECMINNGFVRTGRTETHSIYTRNREV